MPNPGPEPSAAWLQGLWSPHDYTPCPFDGPVSRHRFLGVGVPNVLAVSCTHHSNPHLLAQEFPQQEPRAGIMEPKSCPPRKQNRFLLLLTQLLAFPAWPKLVWGCSGPKNPSFHSPHGARRQAKGLARSTLARPGARCPIDPHTQRRIPKPTFLRMIQKWLHQVSQVPSSVLCVYLFL